MSKEITPRVLEQIKIVAKRIKKKLDTGQNHSERLDIASYLVAGVNTYHDAQVRASSLLKKRPNPTEMSMTEAGRTLTYGQIINEEPTFKKGDWYLYSAKRVIAFEGEFSPYVISIDKLGNSTQLLDFILQIQKKKWGKSQIQGTDVSPTYQADNFISLIDDICHYYFDNSIQGVFSPGGHHKEVVWPKSLLVTSRTEGE